MVMKMKVLATAVGVIAAGVLGGTSAQEIKASCRKYYVETTAAVPHPDFTCKNTAETPATYKPVADDVWRWKCGETAATACQVASSTIEDENSEDCNKCYLVTYKQEKVDDATICETSCPAFTRQVYVKTVDKANTDAVMELSGPAMQRLCPYKCSVGSGTVCVEDPASCKGGVATGIVKDPVVENGVRQPGVCADGALQWTVTSQKLVNCDGTEAVTSPVPAVLSGIDQPADADGHVTAFTAATAPTDPPPSSTDPAVTYTARCHRYWVKDDTTDHPDLTCHNITGTLPAAQKPVAFDVTRWECGKTLDKPCLAAKKTIADDTSGDCSKCYLITYAQPESTDAACADKCPAFTRKVFVKTVDAVEDVQADFDFELSGVAMQRICPYVCKGFAPGKPVCVENPAHCAETMQDEVDKGVKQPGSCLINDTAKWAITYKELACNATVVDQGSYTPGNLAGPLMPAGTASFNETFIAPSNSGSAGGRRATATFAAAAAVGSLAVWLM